MTIQPELDEARTGTIASVHWIFMRPSAWITIHHHGYEQCTLAA